MKILILGNGGRESALSWKFSKDGHLVETLPGNGGTSTLVPPSVERPSLEDLQGLANYAETHQFDLTVVGPEQPLAAGIVDVFTERGLRIFGPTQKAAMLESSKSHAKLFMFQHGIPTAAFHVCTDLESARDAVRQLCAASGCVVVKPSGLTAGKGVTVCRSLEKAEHVLEELFVQKKYGDAGTEVVIEECLEGTEVSLQVFCDGSGMITMPIAQDHKRLLNGDEGPNTGGMGAFCPSPVVDMAMASMIHNQVIDRTLKALREEGIDYRGVLYFGLMLTRVGPKVLEFNCRFGDPEAQAVLPLMKSDLAHTMLACIAGDIHQALPKWNDGCSCVLSLTSGGYPEAYETGFPITGLDRAEKLWNAHVFHAGTRYRESGELETAGGRVLSVVAVDDTLASAIREAHAAARLVHFENCHMRTDIGAKVLEKDRSSHPQRHPEVATNWL